MSLAMLLQAAQDLATSPGLGKPILGLSEIFGFLFLTIGPPIKTPAAYFVRTHQLDAKIQRALAFKTFFIAIIILFLGALVGTVLRSKWHISGPAMLLAGGIIFFLVSLRSVLDQYDPVTTPPPAPEPGSVQVAKPVPTAFDMAVPMIVTPYGLAAVIIMLSASQSMERTVGIALMLLAVMVFNLVGMLFAGPMLRAIGPMPFKLFGTIIGSLTVGLSIQMMIAALITLGVLSSTLSVLG